MINSGLSFGLSAVIAKKSPKAVKESNATERKPLDPVITLVTTPGRFNITEAAMKQLDVTKGEHVLFVTNYEGILAAIAAKSEEVVAIAIQHDLDVDSIEFRDLMLKEFGKIYVTKGFLKFASDGKEIMSTIRLSKKEAEEQFAIQKADLCVTKRPEIAARVVEKGLAVSVSEVTNEQIEAEVNIKDINLPVEQAHFGSKISPVSSSAQLFTFSDSTVYGQLALNVPADHNAIFAIKPETTTYPLSNGVEEVECVMFELELKEYKAKQIKKSASKETVEGAVEEVANEEIASTEDQLPFEGEASSTEEGATEDAANFWEE